MFLTLLSGPFPDMIQNVYNQLFNLQFALIL